jgi:hypothetical protein
MARTLGGTLGKIIHTTSATTQRDQSIRMIAYLLQELTATKRTGEETLDIAAFIFAHLKVISNSVDQTALAWEKRDYWVKADTFRRQWSWVERPLRSLEEILKRKDITALSGALKDLARVLPPPKTVQKKIATPPWPGFWKKLFSES